MGYGDTVTIELDIQKKILRYSKNKEKFIVTVTNININTEICCVSCCKNGGAELIDFNIIYIIQK